MWLALSVVGQESLSSSELLATDAQQRLDNAQFNLVLAGTEQVPVTTSPASVPLTRGVAILLVPAQQGLFGDQGLSIIVSELNSWGWFTLVMPAPPVGVARHRLAAVPGVGEVVGSSAGQLVDGAIAAASPGSRSSPGAARGGVPRRWRRAAPGLRR